MSEDNHRQWRVTGKLKDETIEKLMAVIREADDAQPHEVFAVALIDPASSTYDGLRVMQDVLGCAPEFTVGAGGKIRRREH